MSGVSNLITRKTVLVVILLSVMVLCIQPLAIAGNSDGHIGGKPDIGQGDGIPQTKPGTITAGEQNQDGDANQGSDPAQDGGDGIPNEGPTEGNEHGQQGPGSGSPSSSFLRFLLGLFS